MCLLFKMIVQVQKVFFTLLTLTMCLKFCEGLQDMKDNAIIQEVDQGQTAQLPCRSNNANHVFLFWQFQKDGIIFGPRNEFNQNKYNYEVVSGNLTIWGTTVRDEGLYICVSQGIDKMDFLASSVKLAVHKDWEEVYESDYDTNLTRVCAALGVLLGVLILIYIAIKLRQNYRREYLQFGESNEDDDDSTEEIFNREPSTSTGHTKIVPNKTKSPDDFEKVYSAINMTENS